LADREILTNAKKTKELGRVLMDALGFLSFLFGSLILLSLVFGMIGSMFMSTKPLFRVKRVKRADDKKEKS
jgi:hypothetical protein